MNTEKRTVGGYEIKQSFRIGDKEVLLGENLNEPNGDSYMCCFAETNALYERYSDAVACDDYLKIAELYTMRLSEQIKQLEAKAKSITVDTSLITPNMCESIDDRDLENEVIVLKPTALRAEYRLAPYQILYCNGGNGARHTPSVYGYQKGYITSKKSVGRGQWQTRTVQQILKQEIYTGKLVQGKTDTVAKKQIHKDKSEWIVVENTHEAIISQELFDAAQERMRLLKERQDSLTITPYSENIWKGKIFCGDCGRALHRQRKKFKTKADGYYLYCLTNTRYERGGCSNSCIPEDELLKAVMTSISMQASVLVNKKQLILCSMSDRKKAEEMKSEITGLKRYINKNQNYLNSLYESLVNNIITADEYQSMRKDYGDKISEAVKKIHSLELLQSEVEKKYNHYCDLSDAVETIVKNNSLTKELINKLIDKIYVYKGRKVEIIYNFENEYESEVADNV